MKKVFTREEVIRVIENSRKDTSKARIWWYQRVCTGKGYKYVESLVTSRQGWIDRAPIYEGKFTVKDLGDNYFFLISEDKTGKWSVNPEAAKMLGLC